MDHLSQRWSKFSWFGLLPVKNDALDEKSKPVKLEVGNTLNHIEAILIAAAEPPLNLQRGPFGYAVKQYLQDAPEVLAEGEEED